MDAQGGKKRPIWLAGTPTLEGGDVGVMRVAVGPIFSFGSSSSYCGTRHALPDMEMQ
jgi:hypothetical protein